MSDTTHERLREAREELGLSRERTAARLIPPVSAKTLERWEKGISPIKGYRLLQLADLYGVPVGLLKAKPPARRRRNGKGA